MGKRKCIGIIYSYNDAWIGGTYYAENIIAALSQLPDSEQPKLKIYASSSEEYIKLINKIPYRYAEYVSIEERYNLVERVVNLISRFILKKNVIDKKAKNSDFAFVFPNPDHYFFDLVSEDKKVLWIPDFQEEYLPHFFSKDDIIARKNGQKLLAKNGKNIVFSSLDACNDFTRLYPESKIRKIVLPFAVRPMNENSTQYSEDILSKYGIESSFILIPNQLWKHKNHVTVINAAKILADQGVVYPLIFTGKDSDYRFPDYPQELYHKVESFGLSNSVRFLGFIPKEDLAELMQKCSAIIQPSLFEGWSTVIEEAKSLNKYIFASNIPIHQEQLSIYPNKTIFEKENPEDLVNAIRQFWNFPPVIEKYDYDKDFEKFGKSILKIVE